MTPRQPGPSLHRRSTARWLLGALGALALPFLLLWWQTIGPVDEAPPPAPDRVAAARGEYLARIGNCSGCHTQAGGARLAGGRGIPTGFGSVYSSNITPDIETGIGAWSSQAFWRAMHHGRSRDGSLLYPAFPYPNFSRLSRDDSDSLLAYLRSVAPVRQANRRHELRFPYDSGMALAAWRLLFFRAADSSGNLTQSVDETTPSPEWQRGAYLVNGLGHCSACHAQRNFLGGSFEALNLDGGLLPGQAWLAPSLLATEEAGVGEWSTQQIAELLTSGQAAHASVQGPMAEVVFSSTQYLSPADAQAMALYLKSIGSARKADQKLDAAANPSKQIDLRGQTLYDDYCAGCHGQQGEGVPGAYPALAGNRSLLLKPPVNLLQVIVHGAFAPATAGNPRPFGMPPFGIEFSQAEIASLMTYLRSAWGHRASAVSARDVQRWMEMPSQHN